MEVECDMSKYRTLCSNLNCKIYGNLFHHNFKTHYSTKSHEEAFFIVGIIQGFNAVFLILCSF